MQIFWHYKTFALTPLHRQSQIYFHEQHRRESFLQPNSSMGFFVLLHEDFFSSSFLHPSLTPCVQFPAALLSLSFSLLHLSFLTHSLGVRFLQLVHISAPISRTPLLLLFSLLSLHPFSPSFSPSASSSTSCWPLPVLAGRGGFREQRGVGWFSLSHVMSPTSFIPNSYVPSSPSLPFSSHPRTLIPLFFCTNSLLLHFHLPLLNHNPTTISSSCSHYSSLSDA